MYIFFKLFGVFSQFISSNSFIFRSYWRHNGIPSPNRKKVKKQSFRLFYLEVIHKRAKFDPSI